MPVPEENEPSTFCSRDRVGTVELPGADAASL